jgi:general secretion pathway protein G
MRRLSKKRTDRRGLTLVELIVAFTIMLILTTMAVPLARGKLRAERERELRYDLRTMYSAIDKYKDYCDQGYFGMVKEGSNCYPESLEILVEGQKNK